MFINDVGQNTWEEINDGHRRRQLRLADDRRADDRPALRDARSTPTAHGQARRRLRDHRRRLLQPRVPRSSRPRTSATTSSPTTAAAGSAARSSAGNARSRFASGITSAGRPEGRTDGSLYYLARGGGVVVRIELHRQPGARHHAAAGQPHGVGRAAGHLHGRRARARRRCPISGSATATTSPAPRATYTIATTTATDNGAQFRAVVTNTLGLGDQQRRDADRRRQSAARADDHHARRRHVVHARARRSTISGIGHRSGGRHPAAHARSPGRSTSITTRTRIRSSRRSAACTSGTFVIPISGETSANVWYRIHLTVTDSEGLQATTFRDIQPRTVQVTLTSNPVGLGLTLDGQPITAPYTFTSVVGFQRSIGAPSPQTLAATSYDFKSWSDRGAQSHTMTTPSSNATFTAWYRRPEGAPVTRTLWSGPMLTTGIRRAGTAPRRHEPPRAGPRRRCA